MVKGKRNKEKKELHYQWNKPRHLGLCERCFTNLLRQYYFNLGKFMILTSYFSFLHSSCPLTIIKNKSLLSQSLIVVKI